MKRSSLLPLLFGLFATQLQLSAQDTASSPPRRPFSIEVVGGIGLPETSELNAILGPRGYPLLQDGSPIPGIGASLTGYMFPSRLMGSVGFYTWLYESANEGWWQAMTSVRGSIDLGYPFVRTPSLIVYLAGGGMFGSTTVTSTPAEQGNRMGEEILSDTAGALPPISYQGFNFGLHLDAGINFLFGDDEQGNSRYLLGLKAGRAVNVLPTVGTLNGSKVQDVHPDVPGFYFLLTVGVLYL